MSVRTAARNFDLLLAIATPSTSAPSFSRCWNDSDNVWRQQGAPLFSLWSVRVWQSRWLEKAGFEAHQLGWLNQIVGPAIAGRFIIEPRS